MKNTTIAVPLGGHTPIEKVITQQFDTNVQVVVELYKNDEPFQVNTGGEPEAVYVDVKLPNGSVISRKDNSWYVNNWVILKLFSDVLDHAGTLKCQIRIKYTTYTESSAVFNIQNNHSLIKPNWQRL